MRLDDEQVLPAVVVIVDKAHAPAGMQERNRAQTRDCSGIVKGSILEIRIKCVSLMGEIRDDDIGPAVVVVVFEINTHAGEGVAVAVESGCRNQADFFEGSVAAVVK